MPVRAAVPAPRHPFPWAIAAVAVMFLVAASPARAQLSGTYTIGAGGDYPTFTDAVAALTSQGVSGPVTFDVLTGAYSQQLVIPAIAGAGPTSRVTFRSATGNPADVLLQFASVIGNEAVVEFAATSGVTLSSMTIELTAGSPGGVGVLFTGPGSDNQLTGCVLLDTGVSSFGIQVLGDQTRLEVSGNTLYSDGSGGLYLDAGYFEDVRILGNRIQNGTLYAIYWTGPTTGSLLVANNFLVNSGMEFWAGPGTGGVEVAYNSVSSGWFGLAIFGSGSGATPNSFTIVNNVLSTTAGGSYAYLVDDGSVVASSDHNDIFAAAGALFAAWNGSIVPSLAQLRAASGRDLNSVSVDPGFVSAIDLHTSNPGLNGFATPIATVTTDFDGEPRDVATPDIGADEFTSSATSLAGTYTIGVGQDYTNFADATAALATYGVAGPVTFDIAPGTHVERLIIARAIPGASATNRVTFRSQTGNAADATIRWDVMDPGMGVVDIAGASWVTVTDLTIALQGSAGASAVRIDGAPIYGLQVLDCVIQGPGSGTGIELASDATVTDLELRGNTITEFQLGVEFRSSALSGVRILGNAIHEATTTGLLVRPWTGAAGALLVANNLFDGATVELEQSTNSDGFSFYHNTVRAAGFSTAFTQSGFDAPAGSLRVRNNIFTSDDGIAIQLEIANAAAEFDHNLLYTMESSLAVWGVTGYTTLEALQLASGLHGSSVSFNPGFPSSVNLVPQLAGLADRGAPIPGVTTDLLGQPRSATAPDLGAYEWTTTLAPLTGTYTVGGGGAYPGLPEAVSDLNQRGVSGPVTFDVLAGLYVGQVRLGGFAGAAPVNRVTFRSQTGSAADVTLRFATSAADQGVFEMTRADHVTLSALTLEVGHASGYGTGLLIAGGAAGVKVTGCAFLGLQAAGYGIHLWPAAYLDSLEVSGNTIPAANRAINASFPNATGVRITGNRIQNATRGISLESSYGPPGGSLRIANNFLTNAPLFVSQNGGSDGIEILHNSVWLTGNGDALTLAGTGPAGSVRLQNNVVATNGSGRAWVIPVAATIAVSDHNDLYTSGATLATLAGVNYRSLTALQAAFASNEAHSVSTWVPFVSDTDLHTTVAALDGRGTPLATVTDDIDGQARDATTPDIGADEFTGVPGLAGTYTIGAGGAYATFASAIADLGSKGVAGPVTFDVLSGTYVGQVGLAAIPGSSPANRVTIRSQTGNAANVTLQFATANVSEGVLQLTGSDYVTVSSLTLQVTQASGNGCGIVFQGATQDLRLENCVVTGLGSNGYGIRSTSGTHEGLVIRQNTVAQSTNAISFSAATFIGARVERNLLGTAANWAIEILNWQGPPTGSIRVANNVVTNGGIFTQQAAGGSEGIEICNNSVTRSTSGTVLSLGGGGANNAYRVLNNALSHTGGLAAYVANTPASVALSDHNSLHTSGPYLVTWGGVVYGSLAAFQAATGMDPASVEGFPGFIDANLHMRSSFLNAAALPIAGLTEDFDGDPRDPSTPDIGADEFAVPYTPLAGTYTVGVGGQYNNLTSAVIDLQLRGVSGPVTFNLLTQTFPEQLVLNSPIGVSPANRVTFRSQTGNAANVTVTFNPNSTGAGVMHLSGADYITLSDLTLQVSGTGNGSGVSLSGGTIGVRVQRCVITGMQSTGYGVNIPLGARADSAEVSGNTIGASNRGVYSISATLTGVRITGNSIADAVNQGVLVDTWTGPATGSVLVANNLLRNAVLRFGTSGSSLGLDVFHNTLVVATTADALTLPNVGAPIGTVRVRNNILACPGGGRAMVAAQSSAIAESDNNDLYTAGPIVATIGGNGFTTLAAYRAAASRDSNSVSCNPGVLSPSDLHTTLAALDGKGAPLALVTTDFDGEARDAGAPDIGADEFVPGAALAGTYTIGAGGTYATFAAANADLLRKGVSAPVSFRALNGTYTERLLLETPGGASAANRVSFESQSGSPADVTLQFATTGTTQGVAEFLGADWTTVRAVTFRVTQATGLGCGVRLTGNTQGAAVTGVVVSGLQTSGFGVSVPSGSADSLEVTGCSIDSGARGISFDTPILRGVRVTKCSTVNTSGIGFYLSGWIGYPTGAVFAANNSFASQVQIRTTGLSSVGVDFDHNSVSVTSGTNDAAFVGVGSGQEPTGAVRLRNNVFAAFSGGRALSLNGNQLVAQTDYNDLFSSGAVIANNGSGAGTQFATLADWQGTGRDLHSVSVHPGFLSVTNNLHRNNLHLDGLGLPLASVTDDIDGEPRSATAPDMGADESAPIAPLAGAFSVGTGGDYATPAAAIADLYQRGVSGPVSLNLLPGTYSGQWFLQTPAGASPANRVTVRSQSGNAADVTLQATLAGNTQGVVELRGADYVTVSAMTLQPGASGTGVLVNGRSTASQILDCQVTGLGSAGGIGIYLIPTVTVAESLEVRGNSILAGAACFYVNGGTGLTGVRVVKNTFNATGTTAGPIAISGWTGPATGAVLVANNFITGGGRVVFNQDATSLGAEFCFNSVSMASTQAALYLGVNTGTPPQGSLRIKNNVLANSGTGSAYQVLSAASAAAVAESDYNDLYKSAAGTLANWAGTNYASLATLQAASGKDAHSVSGNPVFASASDLHTSAALLAGAATPIASVPDDIDGQPRDAIAPDIGADESLPAAPPLAGTYTIGAGGGYSTFSAAVTDLVWRGISGPVTFDVLPGTYTEQLTLDAIVGASPANRVTFRSQTGNAADATLQFSNSASASGVLQLQGADHVTFSKLTIRMSSNTTGAALYLTGTSTGVRILDCTIAGSLSGRGLLASSATLDSLEVRGSTVAMTGEALFLNNCTLTGVKVVGNKFAGVANTTTGGLIANPWTGPATGALLIANNFCMGNARLSLTQGANSQGLEIYSNSVGATGANDALNLTSSGTPPVNSVRIKNNIFYCASTGRPLVVAPAVTAVSESDYNDLYKPGAGVLAVWGPTNCTTLAALQAASGKDLHSVNGDPLFTSVSDFHTTAAVLSGAGTPIASVPDDIDGDLRHATAPDIGADETPALVPLAGTYTVGPSGAYATIGAAIAALGTNGVSAPVSFLIQNGTYVGTTTLGPIVGASTVNRVRFVSQTGNPADVVLRSTAASGTGSDAVLRMTNAQHVDVDSITFSATGTSVNGALVWFQGTAGDNRFRGCTFDLASGSRHGLVASSVNLDGLVVRDCRFQIPGGSSNGIQVSGSSTGNGAVIENNTFTAGVGTNNGVKWGPTDVIQTGMLIRGNTITLAGLGTGIELDYANGAEVSKNRISGVATGLNLGAIGGSTLVANNFVQASTTGLGLTGPADMRVYFNSVNLTAAGNAVWINGSSPGAVSLGDNVLACSGGGVALALAQGADAPGASYNNDLYTTGPTIASIGATDYATLADYRAATGQEPQSVSVPPVFTSVTDLHANSPALDGAGTPLAAVTDDIDGQPRSLTAPDIGADEFTAADSTGPAVAMTVGPSPGASVSTATVTFAWSATDNVSIPAAIVSTWSLDGAPAITLPAGVTTVSFDSLAAGAHTFAVSARDEQGNTGTTVNVPFTYVIPAPSATSPTAGPIAWSWPVVPAAARSWQVEIATTANPDSIVFTMNVQHPGFAWSSFFQMPWQSPENSGVQYVARVSPSVEPYPASYGAPSAFSTGTLLDRDPPSLSIVSGPAEGQSYAGTSANFVVSGADAGVGGVQFSWRLDRGPWSAWQAGTGFTVNGLTAGAHTVQVRAKDALGNTRSLDCPIAAQGLANLWAADDGAPGFDRVGSNDGSAVGGLATTNVNGHAGNALVFNGTDALLEVPDSPALYPGAGSFAVGAWVKFSVADVAFGQRILARREAGGAQGGTAQSHYELAMNNGVPYFEVGTPNGFTGSTAGPQQINDGQWHHLVGVWNKERRYIAIYQDGAGVGLQHLDGEDPFGTQVLGPIQDEDGSPDPLVVGGNQATGSTAGENFFKGQVDDIMYVPRALDGRQVEQLYLAGGHGPCAPVRRNFGVDQVAPVVAFEAGPADNATLIGDSTSYAWSATDNETPPASMTFRSVLDGAFSGAYTTASSRALTGLADGLRTFRVEAKDLAGNVSAPAARTLRVHKTAPDLAFDSPAAGAFTGADITVAWHLSAHSALFNPDSVFYEYRLDGGAFGVPSRDSSASLAGLPEGPHTVDVRVTDNAGLTNTRSRAFIVDVTPPVASIVGGPPEGGYSTPSVVFTFAGTDNLTPVGQLRFSRSLDGGAFTTPTTSTTASFGELPSGPHLLAVRAVDSANNTGGATTFTWTVDASPPETQIAGGPADGSTLNTNSATFDFTGNDDLTPLASLRFQSRLDGASFNAASTATSRTFTGIADGSHTVEVRAVDLAGLFDNTPATRSFTVDAQGPAITIASGPANNACVALTGVSFTWSATDAVTPQAQIEFSHQFDAAPFTAFGPATDASFASLAEGLHTFTLQARDGGGNVTSVARTFRVDVSQPVAAAPTTHVLDSQKIRIQCTATDNSGVTGFRVQVSTDPAFGSVASDVQINATGTYDYIGVPGSSYYARCQASDCAGNTAAFSAPSNVAILANLPNLFVSNVTAPPAAIAGQSIVVDYTVSNNGAGPTSTPSWTEYVYLSPTPAYNAGTAVLLGQRQNVTYLGLGESYTGSVTGTVPVGTSGTRYALVTADAANVVPESNGTDNTTASGPVAITLGAVADLVVTQVVAPPTALSSDTITVSWTVRNDGTGRTDASQWHDAIFLSTDATFDFNVVGGGNIRATDDWLAYRQHIGVLEADSSYTASMQVVLPPYFGGTRHLIVASDMGATGDNQAVLERGAVFEDQHETNAMAAEATEVTQQLPPDLAVDALTTSGSPVSGGGLQVTFTIGNHGFDATGSGAWTDQLYLSADAALDGGDVLLGSYPHGGNVDLDGTYSRTTNVTIPKGTSGPRYLIVKADAYAQLVEFLENNNVVPIAQPVVVSLAPWANLVPSGTSVSDTVVAGGTGTAQWLVTNPGTGAATTTWTDNVDIASSPVWTSNARASGSKRAYHALHAGDSYPASTTFDVPTSYSGTYYVFARTDGQNEVFEHTDEGDNVALIGTVYVKPYPAIDLAVSGISAPATGAGGQALPVTFTVTNQGAGATLAGWWTEEVWLSADESFNASQDLQIATPGHSGALVAGGSYTRTVNGTVPLGLNGIFHVLVRTDPGGSSGDGTLANNTVASVGTVAVTSPAPPQLTVSNVTVAANLDAGQPAQVGWQLNNVGAGPVPNAAWYVGVYLSQDPWLDGSDVSLGSVAGPSAFAGATSAPQQLVATMPAWASGAYYVLVRTDNRNEVWEAGSENDNTATAPTTLTLPPPSDLVVTDVVVPPAGVPGEPILVSYTLSNQGANPAVGQLQNAVYMSSDAAFVSDDDPLVGIEVVNINLPPGTAQRFSHRVSARPLQVDLQGNVTGLLPALSPGAYHAIVKANIRDNIREADGGNNETVSLAQVQTDLAALVLEVPAPFALVNGQAKFYKVTVPAEFDLKLQLSSGVVDATNEMFVAYGRTPDENEYDFASAAEFTANPVVLVPQTQAGTYYVMVVARSLGQVASSENLTLLAQTLPFSIASHAPGAGGAGGRVTMRVRGAGLRDTTEFRLEQSGIVKARATLAKFTNSTDMLARFDLAGVPEGLYDLVAANGLATVVVPGAFAVEPARPIEVAIETDNADVLRRSATAPFTVRLRNPSNQDAPVVMARVLYPAGSTLKTLETSPGLFRMSQLVPSLAPVTGDAVVVHGAGGTDSLEAVDVVGANLAPGEVRTLTLGLAGFESSPYSVRPLAMAMPLRAFLDRQQAAHEAARRALVADPAGLPSPLVLLANDAWAFRDEALLRTYVDTGVLSASDVDNYLFEIDHLVLPSPVYPSLPGGPQALLDELAAGGPCTAAGAIPECAPDVAVPGSGLPACASVFDAADLPVALGLAGGVVARVAGSTAAGFLATVSANARVVVPCDPNLLTGPAGFGTEKWVRASQPMQYRVDFENLPGVASAPAQVVRIVLPIDPNLDPTTFRVGNMGFGGAYQIGVPAGRTSYSTQTYYSSLNLSVRVTAGINLTTREATWVFTTIDPATGQQPTNPYIGFLPVNDDIGSGTGFATYSIQPYANAALGSTVQAQASIKFDSNNPLPTNLAANRVDTRPPASAALTSIEVMDPTRVRVHWTTNNDSTGAGLANVTLYARQDTGPFSPVAPPLTGTSLEVPVANGHTFGFYTLAADNVGNAEAAKSNPEAAVTMGSPQLGVDGSLPRVTALLQNYPNPFRGNTTLRFDLARAEAVTLDIYDVQGRLVSKLLDGKKLEAGSHTIEVSRLPRGAGVYFYRLRAGQYEKTRRMVLIP